MLQLKTIEVENFLFNSKTRQLANVLKGMDNDKYDISYVKVLKAKRYMCLHFNESKYKFCIG